MLSREELIHVIDNYCVHKQQADEIKKILDDLSRQIKENVHNESIDTGDYVATVKTSVTENFDEDKLLAKIKSLGLRDLIKTKEYVDMDALESAIYEGLIVPTELKDCKISKEITRLTYKRSTSNSQRNEF